MKTGLFLSGLGLSRRDFVPVVVVVNDDAVVGFNLMPKISKICPSLFISRHIVCEYSVHIHVHCPVIPERIT